MLNLKPILFNTEMVKAILSGAKTQTRRAMKPHDPNVDWSMASYVLHPKYIRGDVLWVRETWQRGFVDKDPCGVDTPLRTCYDCYRVPENGTTLMDCHPYEYLYKASPETYSGYEDIRWLPSIHMPCEAARIFLRITDVRFEVLQNISVDDIWAEGTQGIVPYEAFEALWDSTAPEGYKWKDNPYVWAYEFERIR